MASRTQFVRQAVSARLASQRRQFSTSLSARAPSTGPGAVPDGLGEGNAKGRTGGDESLASTSPNAPAQPKISNLSVPGKDPSEGLTKEQKEEVAEHNREFDKKHDHGNEAPDDKVDKKFWGENRAK
ncbi:hypothetical protein N3K66_000248 [Trichothecium roseum]|uniref:Uncharacterized protein n=1 Tax=Trichothecium roseum TaxID=47278 RepID=A0ACC0VBZ0_9HYPO|nr:hypothetical protein N3K66_000248 [Trichothecium roseum]